MQQNKGLENIVVSESTISSIIGTTLKYRGYAIEDLAAHATFEEVIYLLWFGKLPNSKEYETFKKELTAHLTLPDGFIAILKQLPLSSHPMALLRSAISLLASFDENESKNDYETNLTKALSIQAKISTIVAALGRLKDGLEPVSPRNDLSFAANFLYMLNGELPSDIAADCMNTALILHADHEFNASTFSARVTVATLTDMYSGITSAIGTLKGPLHGGANEQVMKTLEKIGSLDAVDAYLEEAFAKKEKIMGIGHRVYKNGDPRAFILKEMSKKLTKSVGKEEYFLMSVRIEETVEKEKGLKPNVDFYSASMYHCLGLETDMFTPIFAISRTSGWIAHILEQFDNNRLIRPRAEYTGLTDETYVPIEKR